MSRLDELRARLEEIPTNARPWLSPDPQVREAWLAPIYGIERTHTEANLLGALRDTWYSLDDARRGRRTLLGEVEKLRSMLNEMFRYVDEAKAAADPDEVWSGRPLPEIVAAMRDHLIEAKR